MRTPTHDEVVRAAAEIVVAFAATDGERYFSLFAPSATFLFHTEPERLGERAAYERLWESWIREGWRVLSCVSSDPLVQLHPGFAVFTHTVDTTVATDGGEESSRERETIVFAVQGAHLIAVHEHLSPLG
ncbi:ketosteroid isomerase-like protein [Microbacterium sp. AK009]|uniref:nuclear transport factor 2 family protein n=1 Tax=Microbacterium sp. AK009 TaxID=2723068 RepID=UPI0015CA0252|nr:nuclear transport factor 2 family protein [Microbacterium sp. AK009]NYF17641.1 ketosteroid isomerase-like protein [Microbacterium sp. AK009]